MLLRISVHFCRCTGRSAPIRRSAVAYLGALLFGLVVLGPSGLHAQKADSLEQESSTSPYHVGTDERTVAPEDVERMEELGREGASWYRNPHPTRYFFATNAFGLSGGEGYYQNVWFLLLSSVHYGVFDHLSVGAGTAPIALPAYLSKGSTLPVWGRAELSVPSPQKYLHLGGGALFGRLLGNGEAVGGLLYGSGTVGTRDHNVTLSVGYRHAEGDLTSTPRITVSGMTRIRRSVYLITENRFWLSEDDRRLVSGGVRWTSEHGAVDVAWFRDLSRPQTLFAGIPWLSVTLPFGR